VRCGCPHDDAETCAGLQWGSWVVEYDNDPLGDLPEPPDSFSGLPCACECHAKDDCPHHREHMTAEHTCGRDVLLCLRCGVPVPSEDSGLADPCDCDCLGDLEPGAGGEGSE
jgi:hypothetical protein